MRIQTIVIQLELQPDQPPYTNAIEGGNQQYDHLREFFEQLEPAYVVRGIESSETHHHIQTTGGRCRKCNNFTTYKRQNSATGLCMRCETEAGV